MKQVVVGIRVDNRNEEVPKVQSTLTEYGCLINTRVGLHEANHNCSPRGLILLEIVDDSSQKVDELVDKLNSISGVNVKTMVFE